MFFITKDAEIYSAERKEIMTLNQISVFQKVARLENYHTRQQRNFIYHNRP